ncbi:F-box family protein isoform 1 [Tripterygium wilfordii]|uniref:F-box family protein isoform 1 n=1 Tax=Tripterygium wilfordii TaxID=458696 RepID=A0A7J7CA87_TRIWF|nr:F-box protein At5g07670-like [Tripterygium wilfordii]KAF5731058.1 F-box family protein isoform 1 [Tripterygium wilfordii]
MLKNLNTRRRRRNKADKTTPEQETMSLSTQKPQPSPNHDSPLKKRRPSWSDLWRENSKAINRVLFNMQLQSLSTPNSADCKSNNNLKSKTLIPNLANIDRTLLLSDELLFKILSKLPDSQRNPNSLVCKRWLNLQGRLVRSLKVFDWNFVESGRLSIRFPNLNHVDLINACLAAPSNSGILLTHGDVSFRIGSRLLPNGQGLEEHLLSVEMVDRALQALASGCLNLRKLVVIGASELGLLSVAEDCSTLQELHLHRCNDNVLRGIAAFENLQILKLVGNVDGLYSSFVSDIGLTILAQGCKRLVRLELSGCEGSFDGIKAIGQCCQMLEELTLYDHRMDNGWLAAIPYCENLKTLKIFSCNKIDPGLGPDEYLGSCPALERLHLKKCQLRDKNSLRAIFRVCEMVREVVIEDCWGLVNDSFSMASVCRRLKFLSLEGCSLLTTEGLETVILSLKDLKNLKVISCKNIKDAEVSPALSTLFSTLKEFKWRPDTKSVLASSLAGTKTGRRGRQFFRKL